MNQRGQQISNEIRREICRRYDEGKSISLISSEFSGLNSKTITSIIKVYRTTRRTDRNHRGSNGRPNILSDSDKEFIKALIHEDVSVTLNTLKARLETEKNKVVSLSTIYRAIGGFNFSFKRIQLIPAARNTESNIIRRHEYAESFLVQDEDKFVFIDEMGINCSSRHSNGWSIRGTTPQKIVQSIRSKNFSVCAAISKRGLLKFKVQDKPYNTKSYIDFINLVLQYFEEEHLFNMVLVMDNASIHKANSIVEIVETKGHRIQFLPAYSPQLNPIEEVFSQWKSYIKALNSRKYEELNNAILNSSFRISSSDCIAYFNHMKQFLMKALNNEEF